MQNSEREKTKMRRIRLILFLLLGLWMTGCGTGPSLMGREQSFSLEQIDTELQGALPVTRKAAFGSVKVVGMVLQQGAENRGLEVPVKFIFTSYEIPEGIQALITYSADLRYDPASRKLTLGTLKPLRLEFANPSLEEYISARARKGIPVLVASAIRSIPLQILPEGFSAHKVTKADIEKDKLLVEFQ